MSSSAIWFGSVSEFCLKVVDDYRGPAAHNTRELIPESLIAVADRGQAAMAPKNWGNLCASLRRRYGSGPSGIAMGEVDLRFFVEI